MDPYLFQCSFLTLLLPAPLLRIGGSLFHERLATARQVSSFYGTILGLNNVSFEVLPGITGLKDPMGQVRAR